MVDAGRIPVIAAVGEVIDRPADLWEAREPVKLMVDAVRKADAEAGGALLRRTDAIDVVNQISWPYTAPDQILCANLGIAPRHCRYGLVGGETPLAFLQQAAERIRRGESEVALICGGEAHRSANRASRDGVALNWTPRSSTPAASVRGQDLAHALSRKHGVDIPATVYPLYENAQSYAWGQSPHQALEETGRLWSGLSQVAATNPYAALRLAMTPESITAPSPSNRLIAWPYTKLMVANIAVNQGAALFVTSLAAAREAGLDDGRLVFFAYGNAAEEPVDYLQRDGFTRVAARDAVLGAAMQRRPDGYAAFELYSCFPCVPKAARRTLGLAEDTPVSVAGGLTFFGAPLNNYMSHATAAMVRTLREGGGEGLLYSQGGFATKHCVLVLRGNGPPTQESPVTQDLQGEADAQRAPAPPLRGEAGECAEVETFTVIYGRDGERRGVVVVRPSYGGRTIADVVEEDAIDLLESRDTSPIGWAGALYASDDGRLGWRP